MYAYIGENLTFSVRRLLWEGIIYKHVAWFDNKERAPGVLTNVLSEDITEMNGLTSETIAHLLEAVLGLVIGIILSFIYTWQMALITMAVTPFVLVGAIIMAKLQWKVKNKSSAKAGEVDYYTESNALLSDIIMNYRTVVSFGEKNIQFLMKKYDDLLIEPNRLAVKNAHISGILFGYSMFARFAFIASVFYFGTLMIVNHGLAQENTFTGIQVLFMSAMGAGLAVSHAPSASKAKESANKVFAIVDEPSLIDVRSTEGIKKIERGEIEFDQVDFRYPSRKLKVLNKMDLKVPAYKKIALVGHSGCGKSTITNLLLRFYNIGGGHLMIDGKDISEYNIKELRKQIGFVMQEPLLFNTTIKENILYGNPEASDLRVR
jgi:ATP-binding cassette subfamily B (MDR/TAP) protein 1